LGYVQLDFLIRKMQTYFFKDSYLEQYQSQAEGLLSQDSTYQTDPSYFAHSQTTNNMGPGGGVGSGNVGGSGGGQLSQF
jgi:uncharacterized membrane protein